MPTSYADSAQAREWDRLFDDWGRSKKTTPDDFHDYEAAALRRTEFHASQAKREIEYRANLKRRIAVAITQMEVICPPKGGAV